MIGKIYDFFETKNYKELMISYLYFTIIIILILTLTIDIIRNYYLIFEVKLFMLISISMGSYFYQKSKDPFKVEFYITLLIIISEITLSVIVFQQNFLDYSTVYPMLITFAIFYFYRLEKIALITGLHHLYWIVIYTYASLNSTDHPILHNATALVGMGMSYFFMNMFGFAYYISTDIYQKKLESSNAQKEILLKEIHHRIKNNLNLISSILGLQQRKLSKENNELCRKALEESRLRISTISLVHSTLYKEANFVSIDFKTYVQNLSTNIRFMSKKNIEIEIQIKNIYLNSDKTLMLGILLNELLTNSIKYAFNNQEEGRIFIALIKEENKYTLDYCDFSNETVDIKALKESKSLGIHLLHIATDELEGTLSISNDKGLTYQLIFND